VPARRPAGGRPVRALGAGGRTGAGRADAGAADLPLAHLTAVELDERALAALAELEAAHPGRLTVVRQDARGFDGTALPAPRLVVPTCPTMSARPC
jgi:16S rRNA (adenine1518-N6/adenine1519-N6)-dimethyltransferase